MPGRGVKGTASNPSPKRTALKRAPGRPDNRLRAEYGRATQRLCRRSRLIARQLEALRRPNRRPQLATLPPQRRPTPTTRIWRRAETLPVSRWVPCRRTTTRPGRLESGPSSIPVLPVADGVLVNRCQRQRHQRGQVPRLRGRWCGGWSGASAWLRTRRTSLQQRSRARAVRVHSCRAATLECEGRRFDSCLRHQSSRGVGGPAAADPSFSVRLRLQCRIRCGRCKAHRAAYNA